MCRYHTLYHDDAIGYVVRCAECEKIQMGYSNLVITFTTEDFISFKWWLQKTWSEQDITQGPTIRNIFIPTPCEGMKLLLSLRELESFNNMLETADSELQSIALLKLFDK